MFPQENCCKLDAVGSFLRPFLAQSGTTVFLTCSSLHVHVVLCIFWFVIDVHIEAVMLSQIAFAENSGSIPTF